MANAKEQTLQAYESLRNSSEWIAAADSGLTIVEDRAIQLAAPRTGSHILVLGAGVGRESLALNRAGFAVAGVDISRSLLREATARGSGRSRLAYVVADASTLPFRNRAFDQVLMLGQMLGHIPTKPLRRKALWEARRVVQPSGAVIVSVYNRSFRDYPLTYLLWWLITRATRARKASPAPQVTTTSAGRPPRSSRPWPDVIRMMLQARLLRARILLRALRSRIRRATEGSDLRDVYIHPREPRVRFAPEPGLAFYHLYSEKEFLDDARAAGLNMETRRSLRELARDTELPGLVRNLDFVHYYVLRAGQA